MKNLNKLQISKDFGFAPAIITRSDGLLIDIMNVKGLTTSQTNVIRAMFYTKIKELTREELTAFVQYLLTHLLTSINSKMTSDRIVVLEHQFKNEFLISARELSVQEIKIICFNGVRGVYVTHDTFERNINVINFNIWKRVYLEERNIVTKEVIDKTNEVKVDVEFDFSLTKQQINEIFDFRKDKEAHETMCLRYSKTLPSFIFDQLSTEKLIKEDSYIENIQEAKECLKHKSEFEDNMINNLLETMYATDFDNIEGKINSKAKQLTVYKFIINLKKKLK